MSLLFHSLTSLVLFLLSKCLSGSNDQITFDNIAIMENGFDYARIPSETMDIVHSIQQTYSNGNAAPNAQLMMATPMTNGGLPGVAIFDYDCDGDEDIFVTNGPGRANSLYKSLFIENGQFGAFVDIGLEAGIASVETDNSGLCFGDLNNDGYNDLIILAHVGSNGIYMNNGNGQFTLNVNSGINDSVITPSLGCSLGDINNDGYLDLVIANSVIVEDGATAALLRMDTVFPNELYINNGDGTFNDITYESGILNIEFPISSTLAIAMIDIDLDGDIDIIQADDQGMVPSTTSDPINGRDIGFIHVFLNDGSGYFVDSPTEANGNWMGLSFGDINFDGTIDMFVTNAGDHTTRDMMTPRLSPGTGMGAPFGFASSRWFLGNGDGTFVDSQTELIQQQFATVFGWGTAMFDYDNDMDTDIVYYGAIDNGLAFLLNNPGAILENDGSGTFDYDLNAIPYDSNCGTLGITRDCTAHNLRTVHGLAVGDLDMDGFVDIISVSGASLVNSNMELLETIADWGQPIDDFAYVALRFTEAFVEDAPEFLRESNGQNANEGTLFVEMNSGNNNNWCSIQLFGSIDITSNGNVNRNGIGATIFFTPENEQKTVIYPITAGDSHTAQHSLIKVFGLGQNNEKGSIDILWPNGIYNKFECNKNERLVLPEIPCDYRGNYNNFGKYNQCLVRSLKELYNANVISKSEKKRFYDSNKNGYMRYRNSRNARSQSWSSSSSKNKY